MNGDEAKNESLWFIKLKYVKNMPKVTTQELIDLRSLDRTMYPDLINLSTEQSLLRRRWVEESSSGLRLTRSGKKRLKRFEDDGR